MPRKWGDQEAGVRQPQTASHVCHDEYNCPVQISISRSRSKKDTTQVPDSAPTAASRYMAALLGVGEGCMENWRWEKGPGKPELRRVRPWRASAEPACSKRSYWWSAELECGMRRVVPAMCCYLPAYYWWIITPPHPIIVLSSIAITSLSHALLIPYTTFFNMSRTYFHFLPTT